MSSVTAQQYLEQGKRYGLFAASTQEVIGQLAADAALTPDQIAAQLIEKKVLTRFQAEQLLAGHGDECVIAGRYQLQEKLGHGGMGMVYKARDAKLDRVVALKVLPPGRLHDADAVARFQREAKALARLSHPHIIQAYDSGEDRERQFLVMEYVEGQSLQEVLRAHGAMPPTLAADVIHQAALGLQHAHQKGLIHRDLKPANLLVAGLAPPPAVAETGVTVAYPATSWTRSWKPDPAIVKILDLGLARFLQDQLGESQMTQEGMGIGTPDYMAPEQFSDALHADARTDIYGLGCTLYQLIAGQVPFPGSSHAEKAEAHAHKEPIPLEERCPELPAGLAFVAAKMMAKHPAQRFQSAAEVADALAPFVAGGSHSMIRLRQTGKWPAISLTKPKRRRRRLLAWTGGIVAVLLVGILVVFARPNLIGLARFQSANSAAPGNPGATDSFESTQRQVVTIENGLTVSQKPEDGGEFRTISEALAKVTRPGMTIRVLDDATYTEAITIRDRSLHAGLILEAPNKALLANPTTNQNNVVVFNVPQVQIRGFRLRANRGRTYGIVVAGISPGVILERLILHATVLEAFGINVEGVGLDEKDEPITIRNCTVNGYGNGLVFVGKIFNSNKPIPCRNVLVHSCKFADCQRGVGIVGEVNNVALVANTIWNAGDSAFEFDGLMAGANRIMIANNSVMASHRVLVINDPLPEMHDVVVQNNLFLTERGPDIAFLGKDAKNLASWVFSHNWRQATVPKQPGADWVLSPKDTMVDNLSLLSRDPSHADFLRPPATAPLATSGAGGNLPAYVGAIPPAGVEPWDWEKTWKALAR